MNAAFESLSAQSECVIKYWFFWWSEKVLALFRWENTHHQTDWLLVRVFIKIFLVFKLCVTQTMSRRTYQNVYKTLYFLLYHTHTHARSRTCYFIRVHWKFCRLNHKHGFIQFWQVESFFISLQVEIADMRE